MNPAPPYSPHVLEYIKGVRPRVLPWDLTPPSSPTFGLVRPTVLRPRVPRPRVLFPINQVSEVPPDWQLYLDKAKRYQDNTYPGLREEFLALVGQVYPVMCEMAQSKLHTIKKFEVLGVYRKSH